jgi:hypothetical protein
MGALSVDSFVSGIHLIYWVSICGVFGRLGFMLVLSRVEKYFHNFPTHVFSITFLFLVTPQLAITNKIKYPPNIGKDLPKDPKEGTLCKVPKTWMLVQGPKDDIYLMFRVMSWQQLHPYT